MLTKPLSAPVVHVWAEDPAFDHSDANVWRAKWDEFCDGRIKHTGLPTCEGQTPATFELKPLTRRQFTRVTEMGAGQKALSEAVAYSLQKVENYCDHNGRPIELNTVPGDNGFGQRLTDASLDALFDPGLFADLTQRILEISQLPKARR